MKKIILSSLLLMLALTTFSQTTPDKEKTINWINSKINLYGSEIKANNGGTYYYTTSSSGIQLKMTYAGVTRESSIEFNNVIEYTVMDSDPDFKIFSLRDKQGKIFDIFLTWQEEADLYKRFENALKDLIKHNIPKEDY